MIYVDFIILRDDELNQEIYLRKFPDWWINPSQLWIPLAGKQS